MDGFWTMICRNFECSLVKSSSSLYDLSSPVSCASQILIISVDVLLLLAVCSICIHRIVSKILLVASTQSHNFSQVLFYISAIFNGGLSLGYLFFGAWIFPTNGWLVMLFQGVTWLGLNLTVCQQKRFLRYFSALKFVTVTNFLLSGFICISSLWQVIADKNMKVLFILGILSFPGSVMFLLCWFKTQASYELLPSEQEAENVTPFARAGFFSRMAFWWLNPLMKKGKEKILEDEDIPLLRQEDRAKTCYLTYMEQLGSKRSSEPASVLSVIFSLHWKELLISGFCAFIKVITMSSGPLFLKAFIDVAEGKAAFRYEGYVLAVSLFLVKFLESLAERQWYFKTRLIGSQVRSMLSAAIYQKQLRLSNAATMAHSPGAIVNYVTADAYRIGEFPFWFHQIWSTFLQLFLALPIVYYTVGLATLAVVTAIALTVLASYPLIKLQVKYQRKLMAAQDLRLKAIGEALASMKILKLYAWETHFKNVIESLRNEELGFILGVLLQKAYQLVLFWSCPILIPAITFWTCYFLKIPLSAGTAFTFLASLRIVQEPVRLIPDVIGTFIEAKVSLDRIVKFLGEPELQNQNIRHDCSNIESNASIFISSNEISWDTNSSTKDTLRNINLVVQNGEKIAICGEVGSGKSTLVAAILGEVPKINGTVHVNGKVAYVSQTAWIQIGTIQENILFGSEMDPIKYHDVLLRCSLVKDLEMLPFRDLTQIGERGVNLSGGQKQRIQLARALYQDADIYLLDDPFSAVDAHTASNLLKEYVIGALSGKTVLLVTHQIDFLAYFDVILLMSAGELVRSGTYDQLLSSCQEFQALVNAHKKETGSDTEIEHVSDNESGTPKGEIQKVNLKEEKESLGDHLVKEEERETGDTGFKPYKQYLSYSKGFFYFSLGIIFHIAFVVGQLTQNYWLAVNIENSPMSRSFLYAIYTILGCILAIVLLLRSFSIVAVGCGASESMFSALLTSLFRAPMSFFDSTPVGRVLSRVSSDLSIIDVEVAFRMAIALGSAINAYTNFAVLAFFTWPVLFVIIPMVYSTILLQRYYFATTKELSRMGGTTKSSVASQLSESIAGAKTIRAYKQEDRFFLKNLDLIDRNASAYFHYFSANEWFTLRLEILCIIVLSSQTLAMASFQLGPDSSPGIVGMELSYGLSLNIFLVFSIQLQCVLENLIISVERLEQYMHIPSEAPEVIDSNRPAPNWPEVGKVEIHNLKVRYRPNAPLVLQGINCTVEGGHKIGIIGRTGSGKTTLINTLFRLVEPTEGKIIIDGVNICTIGLHDLRSHFAIIPQDPTLFLGSVRFNLDPLSKYTDQEIWEVLEKCHLRAAIEEKEEGLNSPVAQDGSNWSMGQRQLFCLGRALLKRSRILVLDEATASIDNATDSILQKTIRTEFAESTVITVAHRIPTVMDCTMVMAISDGKLIEYDEPLKLMSKEGSLFGQLVKEYWSRTKINSM